MIREWVECFECGWRGTGREVKHVEHGPQPVVCPHCESTAIVLLNDAHKVFND